MPRYPGIFRLGLGVIAALLAVILSSSAAPLSAGEDPAEARPWWAFQPIKNPPPPSAKRSDWARTPVDRFILAKLEERNFFPAPAADKRTLIRRAYFDLIGLPPSPAEIEAFFADDSPEAFAKVVDHLLALPQYGQRWGRHWLDVVRYTDKLDARVGEADITESYRYRDWVVDAFNADMPYDQFIKNQIAGDLLPAPGGRKVNTKGIIATGVYAIGEWGYGDADKEKMLTDIVDDQIDLTSRAFLGLTITCARCHDHKSDPISTKDYYGLAGIFFSSHIIKEPGQKTDGTRVMRVPLIEEAEAEKRKADEERSEELEKQISGLLDEHYGKLAAAMIAQADEYLAAAWEYKNLPDGKPTVTRFARERNLHAYALTQWLTFVGSPTLKLLTNAAKEIGGIKGVNGWHSADGAGEPSIVVNRSDKPAMLPNSLVLAPGSLNLHPAPSAGIAVVWRSPIAGRVRVSGKVTDAHNTCGDGVTWSVSRIGGTGAAEIASGSIGNGGRQALSAGTDGKNLDSVEINAGDMIQLAILPKKDHSCDTTSVELELTEIGGAGDVWNLVQDVVPSLHRGNPHPDSYGNAQVWHFHDMTGQAQAVFPAGSAMSKFALAASAGADNDAVRAAAVEVRKTLESVGAAIQKNKSEAKDAGALMSPDASFYQSLTSPTGTFWAAARADDSNLPAEVRQQLTDLRSEMSTVKQALTQPIPQTHALQEGGTPKTMFPGIQDVPVHIRGSYTQLGEVAPRRFPQAIAGNDQPPIKQGSGRRELADWVASPSNPLTARVMVNRIWQHHFGEAIVRTANNFGQLGTPPTHPELLDYLASRFIQHGWSIKAMHREIMLSATYQQSTTCDSATAKADPDNLHFGRMNRRRLDAEGLRDSMLAVAGRLDPEDGGQSVNDLNTVRRTLYVMTIRSDRATYRNLFDAADAGAVVEKRIDSTVAPQALFLLNNSFVLTQARFLAHRVLQQGGEDDTARIDWLYRTLYSRPPTAQEIEIGTVAAARAGEAKSGETVTPAWPWESYCQVLLCANEFMYVD